MLITGSRAIGFASMVLPLLEREFNPAVALRVSAELAEIARDEQDYWDNEISGWLGTVVQWSQPEWTRGLPGIRRSASLWCRFKRRRLGAIDAKSLASRIIAAARSEPGPTLMNASVSRPWLLTEPRAVQRRV
jgi:hypothetical protein